MANGFAAGGNTAPYPSNGFPSIAFYGPGTPGVRGTSGGGSGSAVSGILPAAATKNHLIAIVLVLAIGYGLWHVSAKL